MSIEVKGTLASRVGIIVTLILPISIVLYREPCPSRCQKHCTISHPFRGNPHLNAMQLKVHAALSTLSLHRYKSYPYMSVKTRL